MTAPLKHRLWRDRVSAVIRAGLVCSLFLYVSLTHAENAAPMDPAPLTDSIDDRRFVGPMGVVGEPDPSQDEFIFKDGTFVSRSCLDWGFSPAPYWVRKEADGLHFLAELTSPDHGQMRYQGVFDGQQIKGSVVWKKERWYWTIEREYRFTGRLAGPEK